MKMIDESKLKYEVGDRVIFKFTYGCSEHTGTIIHVENGNRYPYKIVDTKDGNAYFANDDDILGKVGTDYTVFYGGRRPGKSAEQMVAKHFSVLPEVKRYKWEDYLPDECLLYSKKDMEVLQKMFSRIMCTGAYLPKIKKVIFNDPATIVFWEDGTKTVVKAQTSVTGQIFADNQPLIDLTKTDLFDPEKGLAMAIAKKALGNNGNYYNIFKKWLPKEEKNG